MLLILMITHYKKIYLKKVLKRAIPYWKCSLFFLFTYLFLKPIKAFCFLIFVTRQFVHKGIVINSQFVEFFKLIPLL